MRWPVRLALVIVAAGSASFVGWKMTYDSDPRHRDIIDSRATDLFDSESSSTPDSGPSAPFLLLMVGDCPWSRVQLSTLIHYRNRDKASRLKLVSHGRLPDSVLSDLRSANISYLGETPNSRLARRLRQLGTPVAMAIGRNGRIRRVRVGTMSDEQLIRLSTEND